jgi:hypothetical protein
MSIRIDRDKLRSALGIEPLLAYSKQYIARQTLGGGASVALLPATKYRYAIVLFHGDGDAEVNIDVTVDGVTTTISASDQAIEVIANQSIQIVATNTSTLDKSTPTIEIASIA